jgi:beta-phosphoglucomutase-like phosphatase (HAD superfamily)
MPLEALIFDVDGTLAETEEWHRRAFNEAFAAAGLDWQWDQALYAKLLEVTGGKERMRHYLATRGQAIDDAAIARLHADKTARYVAFVEGGAMTLRPGVARLLHEAHAAGLRLAIATTTSLGNVTSLLRTTLGPEGPGLFECIGAGDMVAAKKPAPDVYQLVLDRMRVAPGCCVAFEDTPNGLHAARGAGIPTVITTSLYGGTAGFEGALMVVDRLGDVEAPCNVLRGGSLEGPVLRVADLRRALAGGFQEISPTR